MVGHTHWGLGLSGASLARRCVMSALEEGSPSNAQTLGEVNRCCIANLLGVAKPSCGIRCLLHIFLASLLRTFLLLILRLKYCGAGGPDIPLKPT